MNDTQRNLYRQRTHQLARHGLTHEIFDATTRHNRNLCFVCRRPPRNRYARLLVHADPRTHAPRALLCNRCLLACTHNAHNPNLADGPLALYLTSPGDPFLRALTATNATAPTQNLERSQQTIRTLQHALATSQIAPLGAFEHETADTPHAKHQIGSVYKD